MSCNLPVRYPEVYQSFVPTPLNPYPMTYNLPPNPQYSVKVSFNGVPMYQTLNPAAGPIMYPAIYPSNSVWGTPYPANFSVPGPYELWYINAIGRRC